MIGKVVGVVKAVLGTVVGKRTIIAVLGLLGIGGASAAEVVDIGDPAMIGATIILLALAALFTRLGSKNDAESIARRVAQEVARRLEESAKR